MPNPFNPSTTIGYQLPESGQVHLSVYNLLGQQVRTLVDATLEAGYYTLDWDGRDDFGRQLARIVILVGAPLVGVRVLRREAVPTWTQSCGTAITRGHLLTGLRGSPGSARGACCVVVRGAAIRGSFARRVASGTVPITGTTTGVFELPGRLPLEALHHYVFYGEFSNFLFGGNNQSHALRPVGKSIS